ncbi:hypothetical protein [Pseudomonas putida]|uniref:Uncharacterized protein n=1 Tax=Pseudomonas putida TaxID=303 RepID=A0A2S3WEQ7_PSEPU|nr:hypothetical protein [Pseudomonas putida]POF89381.1 hypothetical protein BGP80_16005 [Pseudomonas putida]
MSISDAVVIMGTIIGTMIALAAASQQTMSKLYAMAGVLIFLALVMLNGYQIVAFASAEGAPTRAQILSVIIASMSVVMLAAIGVLEVLMKRRQNKR